MTNVYRENVATTGWFLPVVENFALGLPEVENFVNLQTDELIYEIDFV